MALLGNLLAGLSGGGRAYGSGSWNRGRTAYGRRPIGYGRGRQPTGMFGGSLGRMALGGLAAFGMRRFLGGRANRYSY